VCELSGGQIFFFLCKQQCYRLSRHSRVSNIFLTSRGYGLDIIARAGDINIYISIVVTTNTTIITTIAEST
jgi:hypothetical protein